MGARIVGMKTGAGVVVRPYDPSWPGEFERVRDELTQALPPWIISVHHVGSTSVPGLDAKPIIDIMVAAPNLAEALELVPILETLGFEYRPNDDLPDRHYLPRSVGDLRMHHLSLAEPGSRYFRSTMLFRDALAADAELAGEYAALKHRLAAEVGAVRLAYLNGKSAFVQRVLADHGGEVGGDYPVDNFGSSASR